MPDRTRRSAALMTANGRRAAAVLALVLSAAAPAAAAPAAPGPAVPAVDQRDVKPEKIVWIVDSLGDGGSATSAWPARHVAQLREFYEANGFQTRWVGEDGPSPAGIALLTAIAGAEDQGIQPEALGLSALKALAERKDPVARMQLELGLSSAFLRLAGWLVGAEREEGAPRHAVFVLSADQITPRELSRMLDTAGVPLVLTSLAPANSQYQRLIAARRAYKAMAARRGDDWPDVPQGETIRPGRWDARISIIRKRLAAAGEAVETTGDANRYDHKLREAVQRFQAAQGQEADGVIGRATIGAFNAGPKERLAAIDATLERWRRMPRDLGPRYVLVNVPAYRMAVMEGDKAVLEMKVVVGTRTRQTPSFSSRVGGVEINPTWSVPAKLAVEDILPAVRRNPNYLEEHGIRVLASVGGRVQQIDPAMIDWETQGRNLPFRFRQDPGAGNSLGKVKMVFPNDESIYLHDTPKRSLFSRVTRSYSSGCIRLEKPREFADLLLEGAGWSGEQIDAAFQRSGTRSIGLRDGLPIHIAYLPVWVGDDGKVAFHDDVYDRDKGVLQMLQARRALPVAAFGERVRTASTEN
ncbi:MAG: murein L,D-transpeptidase [Alphaproteobacteria bacterium]